MNRTLSAWWLLIALAACGTPTTVASTEPTPPAETPAADPHAAHVGGGGGGGGMAAHMAMMSATRDQLRADLGAAYDAPVPGLDKADATHGKAVYAQHCASCHGATGRGDGEAGKALSTPPSDMTDAFHARYYSDAGRVHLIRKGATTTGMPAWEGVLDDASIVDVYAYAVTLRGP